MKIFELYFKRKSYIGTEPPIDISEIQMNATKISRDDFIGHVELTMDTAKLLKGDVIFQKYQTLYMIYNVKSHEYHFFM